MTLYVTLYVLQATRHSEKQFCSNLKIRFFCVLIKCGKRRKKKTTKLPKSKFHFYTVSTLKFCRHFGFSVAHNHSVVWDDLGTREATATRQRLLTHLADRVQSCRGEFKCMKQGAQHNTAQHT